MILNELKRYTFDDIYDPVLAQEYASVTYNHSEEHKEKSRKLDEKSKAILKRG